MINIILGLICAYVLGSFPTAFIVTKIFKGMDIRKHGSGNMGATNVMRVVGKGAGIFVLIVDIAKGFAAVAVLAPLFYRPELIININVLKILMGVGAIFGHNWTIFLGFKGGKGVATSAGVLLGFSPIVMGLAAGAWILLVLITRYVSLSSIITSILVPVMMYLFKQPREFLILTIIMCPVIIYRHKSNIKRLIQGKESKIWGSAPS
jgi:glycerol-3-phosphate acyltransferase PlsY